MAAVPAPVASYHEPIRHPELVITSPGNTPPQSIVLVLCAGGKTMGRQYLDPNFSEARLGISN